MIEMELKELVRMIDRKADKTQVAKYMAAYGTKRIAETQTREQSPQLGYRFGQDLNTDFTTLFGAFNRVAKQKLDATVLTDFASLKFTDHLYQSKSTQFSAQLTESCALYYRLFDEKVDKMHQQIVEFRQTVEARLAEIKARVKQLNSLVKKLMMNVGQSGGEVSTMNTIRGSEARTRFVC